MGQWSGEGVYTSVAQTRGGEQMAQSRSFFDGRNIIIIVVDECFGVSSYRHLLEVTNKCLNGVF